LGVRTPGDGIDRNQDDYRAAMYSTAKLAANFPGNAPDLLRAF
jgi:hypothetical protein